MEGIESVLKKETKLQTIINEQLEEDKRQGINLLGLPSDDVFFIYNMPNPKKGQKYHPNVTQDDWDEETVETVPTNIDEEEEENLRQLPRRSPRLRVNACVNVPAAGIPQAALTAFMGMEYLEELSHMTGRKLDPVNIERIANRVVHPVTKETITKYEKLISGWKQHRIRG